MANDHDYHMCNCDKCNEKYNARYYPQKHKENKMKDSLDNFTNEELESELKRRISERENEEVLVKRKDAEQALQIAAGLLMDEVQKAGGQDMVNWLLKDLGYGAR